MSSPSFPFSAVVGADDAKLALLLATVDPAIGGVLLRGDKGSAKTTLARGLAALGDAPFVDLPLGATEERVVGSIDLAAALTGGGVQVQPGLLATAHGGVLYVDEVNLLADHLVDVLLDVAATGTNRIERDAVSHSHPARFVLIGSMNPEEGDLRPQLLDRFGLAVHVRSAADPAERAEAVARRLAFDADPVAFGAAWADDEAALQQRLAAVRPAPLDERTLLAASRICVAAGAEGLRADLVLARAAAALAGWEDRDAVDVDDLRAVAPLVLAHRARRDPLDPPGTPPPGLDDAIDSAFDDPPAASAPPPPGADDRIDDPPPPGTDDSPLERPSVEERLAEAGPMARVVPIAAPRSAQADAAGRRSPVSAERGRAVGSRRPTGPVHAVAPIATVTAAASRWAADAAGLAEEVAAATGVTGRSAALRRVQAEDLREPVREARTGNLLVLAVDASGSMGADARMAAVKGALLGLLVDAYQRRDRVALVTFGGRGAEVVLRPTGSVEVARTRLEALPTGGDTPLADGIRTAADLAARAATPSLQPFLVVVTDGRATAGTDPVAQAVAVAAEVARRRLTAVVVDVEPPGPGRLGIAAELAAAMGARHLPLADLTAGHLESALRAL